MTDRWAPSTENVYIIIEHPSLNKPITFVPEKKTVSASSARILNTIKKKKNICSHSPSNREYKIDIP